MKNALLVLTLLSLYGCAFHSGTFSGSASITNHQFRIAGSAFGYAETNQILGIGGLNKEALVLEAKKNMQAKYPLQKGMTWGNVSVDFKTTYVVVLRKTKVVISADIIDFNPANFNVTYSGFYTEDSTYFPARSLSYPPTENFDTDFYGNSIHIKDEVTFKLNGDLMVGQIIAINSYGIKCSYTTPQGLKKIYLLPEDIRLK